MRNPKARVKQANLMSSRRTGSPLGEDRPPARIGLTAFRRVGSVFVEMKIPQHLI